MNHDNVANFLFLDGHVADVREEHHKFDDYQDPLTN
jgi:prepilin-type processing-associated H-X9-DG protein